MAPKKKRPPEIKLGPIKGKLKDEDIIRAIEAVKARRLQREAEKRSAAAQ